MFFYVLVLWGNRATKASPKVAKELSHPFICGLQAHVHASTHTHTLTRACTQTQGLCVDLRVNEWMIEGCRGWGKQCRGNNPSFPGREHRTRVRDKERDGK